MKPRTFYTCQNCGSQSPRWLGKCPDCNQWNTMVEEVQAQAAPRQGISTDKTEPVPLKSITINEEERMKSGMPELDRVLGGGVVRGSLVLVAGDPGIGKSTLIMQAFDKLSRNGIKTLYVTGEESVKQVKLRCARLKIDSDSIFVVSKTSLEDCLADVEKLSPNILAVDSIQTMYTGMVESAPGSISQVREVAGRLMMMSKAKGVATFIVGHVTKDGSIAGPRALEHIVDTVIYFEGNKGHPYRILRAVKNRFGSTNEIGVFEMREEGLAEVKNPSEMFLSERPAGAPGSVVVPSLEGTRPILVEVQALVSPTNFANPRRTCMGIDPNRISLMVAILEKRAGMNILASDIFVNIVGGMWVEEPGADLGAACALASSFLDKPIDPATVLVGEVGLAGEVRTVSQLETRIREAHKLGFKRCIVPKGGDKINFKLDGMEIVQVSFLKEALDMLF